MRVIFAGPKAMLDDGVPQESLKQVGDVEYPVFYMNYNLNPQAAPWRDAIGNAVKYFKGFEYTISKPRDLWFAWGEIMSRIVKLKVGRHATRRGLPITTCGLYPLSDGASRSGELAPSYSQEFSKESLAPYIPSPEVVVDKMLEAARREARTKWFTTWAAGMAAS